MIALRVPVETLPLAQPLVVRLRAMAQEDATSQLGKDAVLLGHEGGVAEYDIAGLSLRLRIGDPAAFHNDVLLIPPGGRAAHRLIRASSAHNTLLVTEQCDQACVMCSQPPKKHHHDLFESLLEAILLAPTDAVIGISGGEPLLHKRRVFEMLLASRSLRPDIHFHALTNAQHFEETDIPIMSELGAAVLWGVPIYAAAPALHDRIVAKSGAFERLSAGFACLARAGARVELRTVTLRSNAAALVDLADFITTRLCFAEFWAVMQLENIGFGRMNWATEFLDTSVDFESVSAAMDVALGRGFPVTLYNFPACTVPEAYRGLCASAISDWKRKYLPKCAGCTLQTSCGGFFEWTPEDGGFRKIGF